MHASLNSTDKSLQLLVVGNGMASFALLKKLVGLGVHRKYSIVVVGDEPRPAYDRVNLTELFSGRTPEDLLLSPAEWYEENEIELITGEQVESIDRANHRVVTGTGKVFPYDQCVLATGSRPFVPPIEGADLPRVFVYRTIEDLAAIRECASQCRTAAVMGGGLLGLEAAKALYDLGLETHVFERAPNLMPRQLDANCAKMLKKEIESLGVQIHLLKTTERVSRNGDQLEIGFAHADSLLCDMLVISAGIRPRDELARSAELECGSRGGIVVDQHMQTNDPRIYAIGECISFNEKVYGLVGPCYQMAEVLAKNLASMANGQAMEAAFVGASEAAQLKLMGVEVSTLGTPIGLEEDCVLISQTLEDFARTLLVQRRKVVGAIGVGSWPEREQIADLISTKKKLSTRQIRSFEKSAELWPNREPEPVANWSEASTVCSCLNVSRGTLSAAILEGHCDIEQLAASTGASTVCGSCRPLLASLLGTPARQIEVPGWRSLLLASGVAAVLILGYLLADPMPFAESVRNTWHAVDWIWRESLAKQVTGFTLLGISVFALLLSLRKRWDWFRFGDYGFWRSLHCVVGMLTLLGFFVHTGLHMGSNFTFVLAVIFLALNLIGSVTGLFAALESKARGQLAEQVRAWRPRLTQLHIWLFWPLPVLILFHIISVYYY